MPYQATVLNVMIATPKGVAAERQVVRDELNEWNAVNSRDRGIVLMPLGWDTDASPRMGDRPQAIINSQLLQHADLLVAVFWTRLGSPTDKAVSGTVEEIDEHVQAGKPAMLYFSAAPVRLDSVDDVQYRALLQFRAQAETRGLVESYESLAEFRQKFARQLAQTVGREWASSSTSNSSEAVLVPVRTSPALSAAARQLLLEAAQDPSGTVLVIEIFGGLQINANGKDLVDEEGPRAEARWKAAVAELVNAGLMADRGDKGEVFALTNEGYSVADLLRQGV